MQLQTTLGSTLKRARRPSSWAGILGFGLLWNAARALVLSAPIHWEEALLPLAVGGVGLVLAPIPWQWTADSRPLASPLRGFLQAAPWNLAWMAAIFLLLPFHSPGEGGQGGGNGPGGGGMGRGRGRWAVEQRTAEQTTTLSPRMLALAAAAFAFAMALGLVLAQKERAELLEEEARESLKSAQLRALQAQMNPHALFNLISALSEMARENPGATEEGLMSLADLLRRLLDHSARSRAPLADERALVETYLELEQIRLGSRLQVHWDWDAAMNAVEAQPLLLQPLVENAIKHGIAPCREGGKIRISLRREGDLAFLMVANTGAPLQAGKDGVGLANLRQRLELVEPGRANFSLRHLDGWTLAEVRTPVHAHG
jgi:two-component sensor histidine kinase